jgi:glycosyltransferase involved in cell wall biosynthesis
MIRSYAIITPARDEAANLPRLAESLAAQMVAPRTWIIVDNGSSDGTLDVARRIAADRPWVDVLSVGGEAVANRGAPIVRALHAGIAALEEDPPEIVVNVDADVSFDPTYFEELLDRFGVDPSLGIASGSAYELVRGSWQQRFVTGSTVWGASRAYRWTCLQQLLPLEERVGWDGADEFKANARGWCTATFEDLPFRHHRPEGARDGSAWRARVNQGETAYFLGYRAWYLTLRALWNGRRDITALGLIWGYLTSAFRRRERTMDDAGRAYLRLQQSPRNLWRRAFEATGRSQRWGAE